MRRTVKLTTLVENANRYLAKSAPELVDARHAIHGFVASQLLDADVYNGFGYLEGWPCDDESRTFLYAPKGS